VFHSLKSQPIFFRVIIKVAPHSSHLGITSILAQDLLSFSGALASHNQVHLSLVENHSSNTLFATFSSIHFQLSEIIKDKYQFLYFNQILTISAFQCFLALDIIFDNKFIKLYISI